MASGITIPGAQRTKDKDEVKDFTLDWSKELAVGDTINTSSWTAPAGITITPPADTHTTTTTTVWVSGGTVGQRYIVTNHVVTAANPSRTEEQSIEITVIDGSAQALDHYCALDDVNKLAPQVPFTDTSKPNAAVVIAFIDAIAREMDSTLANSGYVVPIVSGANALESARETCAWGALGLAQTVRDTGVTTAVNTSGKPMLNIWTQMYRDRLKSLSKNEDPYEWADAPRTSDQVQKQPENILRSFVQSITDDPSYDPDAPTVTRYQILGWLLACGLTLTGATSALALSRSSSGRQPAAVPARIARAASLQTAREVTTAPLAEDAAAARHTFGEDKKRPAAVGTADRDARDQPTRRGAEASTTRRDQRGFQPEPSTAACAPAQDRHGRLSLSRPEGS